MKKLTLIINDDELYSALEDEAASSNRTVEEVAIDAIELWKMDSELDAEERRRSRDQRLEEKRRCGSRGILRQSAERGA